MVLQPGGGIFLNEPLQRLDRRQCDEVAGDEKLVIKSAGGVFDLGLVLVRAEQQTDGRLVAFGHHLGLPEVQVEVHLARVAVLEGADFQVNEQVAAEDAVVEDEVEIVVLVADGYAALAGLEAKAGAEFEEEGLQVVEQGGLEVALEVVGLFCEADELQHVGVADEIGDLRGRFDGLLAGVLDDGLLIGGEAGALVEQGADLPLELADGPAALEAFVLVKCALPRVVEPQKLQKVCPRKAEQCRGRK